MNTEKILKGFRGKQLLTQDNMAEKLGISRQMYNSYENDIVHCQLDIVLKILSCLNVNESEFNEFSNALLQDYLSYHNDDIQKSTV